MREGVAAEALLVMRVNGEEVARVRHGEVPADVSPSRRVKAGAQVAFEPAGGEPHVHSLGDLQGWAHLSLRVHPNLGCQADCVVTQSETFDADALPRGEGYGVRFQPFFLPGSPKRADDLHRRGLFDRGLHFRGMVTPSYVRLSCECDECRRTFLVQSFHAGFMDCEYLYSASSRYTLILDSGVTGAPGALGRPDPSALAALEASLPTAPDGTVYRYYNPFRCPHCRAPYIDFERFPDARPGEYYGNHYVGTPPIRWEGTEESA